MNTQEPEDTSFDVSEEDTEIANILRNKPEYPITHGNSKYDDAIKVAVVRSYVEQGSLQEACKAVTPPLAYDVVVRWKHRSAWWDKLVEQIQPIIWKKNANAFGKVIGLGSNRMADMIVHGKPVVDKEGKHKRVPLSPTELMEIINTALNGQKILMDRTTNDTTNTPAKQQRDLGALFHALKEDV